MVGVWKVQDAETMFLFLYIGFATSKLSFQNAPDAVEDARFGAEMSASDLLNYAEFTRDLRSSVLLSCPSSFPASSGSYSDCTISGKSSRAFSLSSGTLTVTRCKFQSCSASGLEGGCIYCGSFF